MKKMYEANWASLDQRKIPLWFQEGKFGIFIHWGVYSVPAWRGIKDQLFASYAEWYYASVYGNYENHDETFHERHFGKNFKYRDFAPDFKAELFDPEKWVRLFQASGAKYIVLTTKHHDGYCLWPTENPHKKNWRVTDVGPNMDIVGILTEKVKKAGLKMGFYYSMIEWETNRSHRMDGKHFIPIEDAREFGVGEDRYPDIILQPQLKELVLRYEPELIFADGGEWDLSEEYSKTKEFLAWLYNDSPVKDTVVVNDRFCKTMPGQHGDYYSTEYNDKEGFLEDHPWEESRGMGKSYGYNRAEDLDSYYSFRELIHTLVEIVSKGGNFLLNVGPTADGRIPVIQEERLRQIGRWMDLNGEGIYDSISGYQKIKKLPSTVVEGNLYVFLFQLAEEELTIEMGEDINIKRITILGLKEELSFKQKDLRLTIRIPKVKIMELLLKHQMDFITYVLKMEVD